jgi:thioredoxin 1
MSKEESNTSDIDNVTHVTDVTFESKVLKNKLPVLVDFWAPWCGPCRMVAPVVDEIGKQYQGQIKVYKVNTDDNPIIASKYGIRSIPTLMIFKQGERVDMVVGAVPKTTLANTIEKYLDTKTGSHESENSDNSP